MKSDIDPIQSERFLNTQNRQDLIISLEQTLYDISQLIIEWNAPDNIESMKTVLVEPLDFILLTFIDTIEDRSLNEIEILLSLTNDRSKSLQKLRHSFLTSGLSLEYNDRQKFMQITSLFERAIWLLNKLGLLLKS